MSNSLTVSGAVTFTQGTLNTNGQTCNWGSFSSQNSNVRVLTLGASNITVTGTGTVWTLLSSGGSTGGSNATVNAGSSTVTFTGAAPSCTGLGVGGALNNVVFSGFTGTVGLGTPAIPLCANLTVASGATKLATVNANSGNTYTITGTYTLGGNTTQGVNRLAHIPTTVGTQRNFTVGAVVITGDVDFADTNIAYSGAASWTNTGSAYIGDGLGNGGAVTTNATTPATQTATGTASFTWSTHGWTSRVPLPQDPTVINNSFIAGRTITVDMPRMGANTDMSAATGSPILAAAIAHSAYGSWSMATGMTETGNQTRSLLGRGTHTITSNSVNMLRPVIVGGPGATYTLQDDLNIGLNNLTIVSISGTFTANNKNVTAQAAATVTGTTGTINMGSGTWNMIRTAAGNAWNISTTAALNAGTSEIVISAASANARVFIGGGMTYNILTYNVAGSTGSLTLNEGNTFNTINFNDSTSARSLLLTAGTTTTVTNWNVNGSPGALMTVDSATAATHTLTKPSGIVASDYLSVKNSIATGGASWYAGTNSTNVSGNTGWIFTGAIWPRRTGGSLRQVDTLRQVVNSRPVATTRQT